ncbi:MAG: hypothetical protein EZS28_045448, partial [Streblomastix strix]
MNYNQDDSIPINSGIDRVYMTGQMRKMIEEEEEIRSKISEQREKLRELTAQEKEQKGSLFSRLIGLGVYHLADYAYFFGSQQNAKFPKFFSFFKMNEDEQKLRTVASSIWTRFMRTGSVSRQYNYNNGNRKNNENEQ